MSPLTLHLVYGLPTFVVTPLADGTVNSIGLGPLYLGQVGHICWMAKAKSSTGCGSLSYPTPNRALFDSDLSDLKASCQSLCSVMPFRILACSATALLGSELVQALPFVGAWYQWDSVLRDDGSVSFRILEVWSYLLVWL